MTPGTTYEVKTYDLSGLHGISDKTLEMHFKLYAGYVKETNKLNEKIAGFLRDGQVDQEEMPDYSELKRRLGFEYNGMVLHEYYFGNLSKSGGGDPAVGSDFRKTVEKAFGSYATWKTDFTSVAKMRGVGWAVCSRDPVGGGLVNHWVTLHETSNVAGFDPILVVDVWEHAFLLDYAPADRAKYVDACFANLCWKSVEARLHGGNRR